MLTEEASSFGRQARLAISLSWIAGYTNAIVLIVSGQTISHQTGNTTRLGKALGDALSGAAGRTSDLQPFGFIVASFWCGALCSGFLIGISRQSARPSRYVMPMCLETILLALLVLVLEVVRKPIVSATPLYTVLGLSTFAMGLQNATITRISGAVVRTTHLTGVVTDLGLESAQLLLHRVGLSTEAGDGKRMALLGGIAVSFFTGAALGTLLLAHFGSGVLLVPVGFLTCLVLSSAHTWRRARYSEDNAEPMLNR